MKGYERDTPTGIELSFWAWSDQGALRLTAPNQQAVCFIDRNVKLLPGIVCERKPLALISLQRGPVDGLYFQQQGQLNRLRELASNSGLPLIEPEWSNTITTSLGTMLCLAPRGFGLASIMK